ncbi:hypothetical protein FDP41_011811 [Naegleria fowleri]|uniref:BRCT domain-containing protein n=1 Tax=Naegleria fowleri TaxID=5763 RepID=A0A6A5C824_NAEFO|nr:uncharacterized protein FDP41_011811 [Naegleria fowleri]KAF0981950.1 hypothetical protein FDP41_011811 [Naegleria fowleri]
MFRTSISNTQASQFYSSENNDLDFSNISFDDEEEAEELSQVKSQPKKSIGKTIQDLVAAPPSNSNHNITPTNQQHSELDNTNTNKSVISNSTSSTSTATTTTNNNLGDSPVLSLKSVLSMTTNNNNNKASSSSPVHPLLRTNELEVMETDDEEDHDEQQHDSKVATNSKWATPKAQLGGTHSSVATTTTNNNNNNSITLQTTTNHSNDVSPPLLMKSSSTSTTTATNIALSTNKTTVDQSTFKLQALQQPPTKTLNPSKQSSIKKTTISSSSSNTTTQTLQDEISSDEENDEQAESLKKTISSKKMNQKQLPSTKSNSSLDKLFKDLRFTITSISTPTERERVIKAIRSHGGEVIETLEDIQEEELIILIADDCTTKPNYLIALMMEIPLLKKEWIHDSISEGRLLIDTMYKYVLNRGSFLVRSTKQKKLVKQQVLSKLSPCVPMEERIFSSAKVRIIGSKDFKEKWSPILKAGGAKVMTVLKSQTDHLSNFLLVEDYDKLDAKVKKEAKQHKLPILDRDSLLEIIVTLERKLSSDQILNYSDLKTAIQKMAKQQSKKRACRDDHEEDSEESDSSEEEVEQHKRKGSTEESSQEVMQRKKSKPSPTELTSPETKQLSKTRSETTDTLPKQENVSELKKDKTEDNTQKFTTTNYPNGFYFRKSEYDSNSFSQLLQIQDQSMEVICVGDVIQTLDDKYYRVDSFGFSRLLATEYTLVDVRNDSQHQETQRLLQATDRNHVEVPLCTVKYRVLLNNRSGMGERIFLIEKPERLSILDDTPLISVEHRAVNILHFNISHDFQQTSPHTIQILQFNNILFQENDFVKIVHTSDEGSRLVCIGRIRFVLEDRLFIELFRRHPNSEISDHYVTSFQVIPLFLNSISIIEPLQSFNDLSAFTISKKQTQQVQSIFVQEE